MKKETARTKLAVRSLDLKTFSQILRLLALRKQQHIQPSLQRFVVVKGRSNIRGATQTSLCCPTKERRSVYLVESLL